MSIPDTQSWLQQHSVIAAWIAALTMPALALGGLIARRWRKLDRVEQTVMELKERQAEIEPIVHRTARDVSYIRGQFAEHTRPGDP